ncbi:MAG: hypothetical protein ACOY4K_16625 [Pseudomonadota bacterium]
MKRICRSIAFGALSIALAAPAAALAADDPAGDVILDMRLRSESVSQDGFAEDALALTLRTRLGYETAAWNGFKLLVEGEAVTPLVEDYNSTTNGKIAYPVVADPEAVELNRAQVAWTGAQGEIVAGRQRIVLNGARFVGNVGFRQNEQTFDAVKAAFRPTKALTLTWIYVDRVHRVFGDDSVQGEWDADANLVQADYKAPFGQLTGYAYLMAFDNAPAQSNATYGLRLTGSRPLRDGLAATYEAEYAVQSDYRNSPVAFDLDYVGLSAGLKGSSRWVSIGFEQLEGDGVRGFATPLATLHAFQGWADVFLATPRDGVRDLNLRAGWSFKAGPAATPIRLVAAVHDFSASGGSFDYGSEVDLLASAALTKAITAEIKAAAFEGDRPGYADRTKVWITFEYKY